jgi:hypothetical protein
MFEETEAHKKAKDAAKAALVLSVVVSGGNATVAVGSEKTETGRQAGVQRVVVAPIQGEDRV